MWIAASPFQTQCSSCCWARYSCLSKTYTLTYSHRVRDSQISSWLLCHRNKCFRGTRRSCLNWCTKNTWIELHLTPTQSLKTNSRASTWEWRQTNVFARHPALARRTRKCPPAILCWRKHDLRPRLWTRPTTEHHNTRVRKGENVHLTLGISIARAFCCENKPRPGFATLSSQKSLYAGKDNLEPTDFLGEAKTDLQRCANVVKLLQDSGRQRGDTGLIYCVVTIRQ